MDELLSGDDQGDYFLSSQEPVKVVDWLKKELKYYIAAGGKVTNPKNDLLMIFKNNRWDLPKGKLDPDETPAQCAVREVEEETGARGVEIVRGAGLTLHDYEEAGRKIIKTTWWFLMTTARLLR